MVQSMTAFARCQHSFKAMELICELRSVNHRFLEIQFRMPDGLRSLEHDLRQRIRSRLHRGKVDCTLRIEQATDVTAQINRQALLKLLATLEQVRRDSPEVAAPTSLDILRWPGILNTDEGSDDELHASIGELFDRTIGDLVSHRAREGGALNEAIRERLDTVDSLTDQAAEIANGAAGQLQQRLRDRVAELGVTLDAQRLEQEVAILAQKADVAEELDRLKIHTREARTNLAQQGPHGRRLDFLTQEFNREANTLGSKAFLPELSQIAVDLKVAIEQIREQVQNVE